MKHIGLIAGGFKPFTSGHNHLVDIASKENDVVYLFVSNKDRARKGEFPIYWEQMRLVWEKFIKPSFPGNVKVVYSGEPTSEQFAMLEDAEKQYDASGKIKSEKELTFFTIYADVEDIERYNNPRIKKKLLKNMFTDKRILLKGIPREGKFNVSGTKARKALQDNDMEAFVKILPKSLQPVGYQIFKILKAEHQ